MSSHALRVWTEAVGSVIDDARRHLEPGEFWALADTINDHLTVAGRRGPEFVCRIAIEEDTVCFHKADNPSEAARLRDWLRADEERSAVVNAALDLAWRERDRRKAA